MFDRSKLIADLESPANEGFRDVVYDDATGWPIQKNSIVKGNPTWGIGCNVSAFRLSRDRARIICGWQVYDAWTELVRALPWADQLDEPRARALANMAFNLGVPRLLQFRNMLQALHEKRWLDAKDEALNSEWAKQEPSRSGRLADIFATGADE